MSNIDNTMWLSVGGMSFLADNLHWEDGDDSAATLEALLSNEKFPFFPDYMSLVVCSKGTLRLRSRGFDIDAGPLDAMVVLGGQPIEGLSLSPDCRLFFFAGRMDHIGGQIDLDDINQILRHAIEVRRPFILHLSDREYKAAEKMYLSTKDFLQMTSTEARENIISGFARITSALIAEKIGKSTRTEDIPAPAGRNILSEFLSNVRENCRNERSIEFYAAKAHLTPKYFSRIIKSISGKTPGAIIRDYTMAEARSLLVTKRYSIKEVSTILNFSGPSSFGKYFKAAQGCTPGEYIKSFSESTH